MGPFGAIAKRRSWCARKSPNQRACGRASSGTMPEKHQKRDGLIEISACSSPLSSALP